ncbi:tyrosine-type recombinase/integrase [Catellatospora coxensis]|uniref:Putative prophage phiRv2 integrase n=1 Tax=Catellatospora coxensis TaxID=310354 RepID=A0A8J3P526_9ACTN|nr:site-specific integrase [Catellatospora coxensis]GIG04443.1 putative prophage phiRv2 integrase [Catellatospora coxensis]
MSNGKQSRRREFGTVRKLPSGRYQARYTGPDGMKRPAPDTFATKKEATEWLVEKQAEILRSDWIDPDAGSMTLTEYTDRWVKDRDLKPRTRVEYERVLRLHVKPQLGEQLLNEVTAPQIRAWRSERLAAGVGKPTVAKTYRILRAIFATALDDDLIRRNPCRIKGAGQDVADERPTATLEQVFAIAGAIQPRYRLLVLLATFAQLRFGELIALRRSSLDLDAMEVRVARSTNEMEDGTHYDDDPKSKAGKRLVSVPSALGADIRAHLDRFVSAGRDARLFLGPQGAIPRRRNFNRVWKAALESAGIPDEIGLHLHDLRHTGGTLSGRGGATLKELMARLGHSSPRAAMVYQHATKDRDQAIAAALDMLIEQARSTSGGQSGTDMTRGAL